VLIECSKKEIMKLRTQYCFGDPDQEEAAGNRPPGAFSGLQPHWAKPSKADSKASITWVTCLSLYSGGNLDPLCCVEALTNVSPKDQALRQATLPRKAYLSRRSPAPILIGFQIDFDSCPHSLNYRCIQREVSQRMS
jgi:hypothetical protein